MRSSGLAKVDFTIPLRTFEVTFYRSDLAVLLYGLFLSAGGGGGLRLIGPSFVLSVVPSPN